MKYTYYWNEAKDDFGHLLGFFGFQVGQPLSIAYTGDVDFDSEVDELSRCEYLFHIFNTDDRPLDYRGPSMSVGSVIALGEGVATKYYVCESIGFIQLTHVEFEQSQIVPTDPRWKGKLVRKIR